MTSYIDTSFLYKLYVNENQSLNAIAWFRQYRGEVAISELSDVELVSSLSRNFPEVQARQTQAVYVGDCLLGVYTRFAMTPEVYALAVTVAENYAGMYKLKSLDILHLATALFYKVDSMATFDQKLATAAEALGLEVLPGRS